MSLPKWLQILAEVGPQVLLFTPLAPIAGDVIAAIGAAQAMDGATGPQKVAHVVTIADDVIAAIGAAQAMDGATGPQKVAHVVTIATEAAQATNAQAGHVVIDPASMQAAAETAISTVVQVTKMVEFAHENPGAPAPTAVIGPVTPTP